MKSKHKVCSSLATPPSIKMISHTTYFPSMIKATSHEGGYTYESNQRIIGS
ncbi:hypothetical protein J2Z64_003343 [Oceanobacillus polygoni]|uniref:Uncharacterized protein n=1 Tax=Oceanobacillus polygoni TaxID=1235259 RepID=A0A9X1CCS8_9BACI|nr:hypothetical protein [Oceanobacillus polygoni]